MAMRRICEALDAGLAFPMFGDGSQSRDFTYVADAVDATVRAGTAGRVADVYNIGGGEEASLSRVISTLEALAGRALDVDRRPAQRGDVRRTSADVSLARHDLGWSPAVSLDEGLAAQLQWVRSRNGAGAVLA
jgi:UDP-glucose 4-epimerase